MAADRPDSPARTAIFATLRRAAAGRDDLAARTAVAERLARHPRNLVPARGQLAGPELLDLFARMAQQVGATVERLADPADVPAAVAGYLAARNLPAAVRVAPDPALQALPWASHPTLTVGFGAAAPGDAVSVTPAFAGIAETGTLLTLSGPGHPTTLTFLPETHLAVLSAAGVVGTYEEAWDRVRAGPGQGGLPRTACFVTGPSRTGDIEQTLLMHAHGPGRLHILLVGAPGGLRQGDAG